MTAMYKIGVIGEHGSVIGFKALGLDVFPATNADEAKKVLRDLTRTEEGGDEYAIIYIEETLAVDIMTEISKFKSKPTPAIILIPGVNGAIGLGQTALKEAVEKAVGSDIL